MQTAGVTILSTELTHTDRRALSEAWYRTLHLAAPAPRGAVAQLAGASERAAGRGRPASPVLPAAAAPKGAPAVTVRLMRDPRTPDERERRVAATPLARRLARAVAVGARRPRSSVCTIRDGGGRIVVLVRNDGTRTRVVAVCAPHLRERVERALAHARFALAAAGMRSEVA
jgi:pyruvate/2-oxoglutarate dehydrogenase complex dihydrolipoamide acyltransferase (E2) component